MLIVPANATITNSVTAKDLGDIYIYISNAGRACRIHKSLLQAWELYIYKGGGGGR